MPDDNIPMPVNTGKAKEKKRFFDGNSRPSGKWAMIAALALLLAIIAALLSYTNATRKSEASKVVVKDIGAQMPGGDTSLPGGAGTPAYNEKMLQQSTNNANEAKDHGNSYMPPPSGQTQTQPGSVLANSMGGSSAPVDQQPTASTPVTEQQQAQTTQQQQARATAEQQRAEAMMQAMIKQMQGIDDRLGNQFHAQTVTVYKDDKNTGAGKGGNDRVAASSAGVAAAGAKVVKSPVKPGLLVYASNDILLSSEGSTGARATVLNGDFKDWVLLGTFTHSDTSMKIQYTTLVAPDGTDYQVNAYAVSPSVDSASIATEVNNHNLERWGGLIAAAFLQGFGNASLLSGTQNVGALPGASGVGGGTTGYLGGYITSVPTLSLMQKGAVALGSVGTQVSNQLTKNFNRPPTITLNAGEPIGVLFVK